MLHHLLDGTIVSATPDYDAVVIDLFGTGTDDNAAVTEPLSLRVTCATPGIAADVARRLRHLTVVDVWADSARTVWHFDPFDSMQQTIRLRATAPVAVPTFVGA